MEEKTLKSKDHRDKLSENKNLDSTLSGSKEGVQGVGATSSERTALVVEKLSDCCALIKRFSEEKNLQVEEPIPGRMIDKQIANEIIDRRCDSIAETAALALTQSNRKDLRKLSSGSSVCGYVKVQPCSVKLSKKDKDLYRQMAKIVVQEVFARIGCYESFVRRASWADEPSCDSKDLDSILMAYSFTDPYEKVMDVSFYLLTMLLLSI